MPGEQRLEKYLTTLQVKKQLGMEVEITQAAERVAIIAEALPPSGVTVDT